MANTKATTDKLERKKLKRTARKKVKKKVKKMVRGQSKR
jgi:hypothetical protein